LYCDDLACVRDAGFGDLARRAAPEIVRLLRARGAVRATYDAALRLLTRRIVVVRMSDAASAMPPKSTASGSTPARTSGTRSPAPAFRSACRERTAPAA
jgi:hypothetical protein